MNFFRITMAFILSISYLCLCGCHPKAEPETQAATRVKEAKPGAAIKLISSSLVTMNANEITSFELVLDIKDSAGALGLELSATNGLELLETQVKQTIQLNQASHIQLPIKLRALENGRYYLHIHTAVQNDESLSTRNLALIVQVGPQALSNETASPHLQTQFKKGGNENVKVLPAQETISNQ